MNQETANNNIKGKGLDFSRTRPPPNQPPNEIQSMNGDGRTQQTPWRWGPFLFNITQGPSTSDHSTAAYIDCNYDKSHIGTEEAQELGLETLPSVLPAETKTIKGPLRCPNVVVGASISSRFPQIQQRRSPKVNLLVLPPEHKDVPLTIGKRLFFELLRKNPRFRQFCRKHFVGFGEVMRSYRHARSSLGGSQQSGLRGSPVHVSSTLGSAQQSHDTCDQLNDTFSSGSVLALPQNHTLLLHQARWQPSPVVSTNWNPMGLPDPVPPPSTQAVFDPTPANAAVNMRFPGGNPSGSFSGGFSGGFSASSFEPSSGYELTPWYSQGINDAADDFNYGDGTHPLPPGPPGGDNPYS